MSKPMLVVRAITFAVILTVGLMTAPPAQAHESVCAGRWVMSTPTMTVLTLVPTSGSFVADYVQGGCTPNLVRPNMFGFLMGNCASMSGTGTMAGHPFDFVTEGTTMVVIGGAIGTLSITPAVGENCVTGVDTWLLVGTLVLNHVIN